MTTLSNKIQLIFLSERKKSLLVDIICYIFILLFVYTAGSKMITIETFQHLLVKYPLVGKYGVEISYVVPVTELVISAALITTRFRKFGLIAAIVVLTVFLGYIVFMMSSGSTLPCSCGGIIAKLSWQNHIWFNSVLIFLAMLGIALHKKT